MAKFTVSAVEYREKQPVTTEGTMYQATEAFCEKHGIDGLNLALHVTDDAGKVYKVTPLQHAKLKADEHKKNPRKPPVESDMTAEIVAEPEASVEEKPEPKHDKKHK
jgi:hypothetical protein